MKFALAIIAVLCLFSGAAQARHGHHEHHGRFVAHHHMASPAHHVRGHHRLYHRSLGIGHHRGHGVPWCGIWMQGHTGIHGPGNLAMAREWAHVGRAASGPGPGIIGVMPHHVFQVVQVLGGGQVLAISGNDGGAVRTRPRSTAGVIAWRQL